MKRSVVLAAILALAFLGIADAWYLAHAALSDTALTCGVNTIDGCNTVAQSPYSRLLGIPLGIYGVVFYGLTFVVAAVSLIVRRRLLERFLAILGVIGLLASLAFVYVQAALIQALCIYCLFSFAISAIIFLVSFGFWKSDHREPV